MNSRRLVSVEGLTLVDGFNLAPCPFCSGPPVLFVENADGGGHFQGFDKQECATVHVFCHECGAEGGVARPDEGHEYAYTPQELRIREITAANNWNTRSGRHVDLYHGNDNTWQHYYELNPVKRGPEAGSADPQPEQPPGRHISTQRRE